LYEASETALTRRVEELAVLSAALTHDLRGLMGSILGFSGLLASESLSEDGQQMVHGIDTAGRRMVEMIDQLLDIATLSQTPQLHRQPCDLGQIAQEVTDDLQGKAREGRVDLRLVVHGEPYSIRGDAMRLYRMLVNLVDNALRHSPAHTVIILDLAFMAEGIIIRVQDEGPGIREEDLAYIFEEYYRGQREQETLGTGLGLTMVRTTAQAHGGTVDAHNRAEGGAEFIVTLPGALRVSQESQVENGLA
jgi:signal transduction histidine kinase